jgi:hypothetical protein
MGGMQPQMGQAPMGQNPYIQQAGMGGGFGGPMGGVDRPQVSPPRGGFGQMGAMGQPQMGGFGGMNSSINSFPDPRMQGGMSQAPMAQFGNNFRPMGQFDPQKMQEMRGMQQAGMQGGMSQPQMGGMQGGMGQPQMGGGFGGPMGGLNMQGIQQMMDSQQGQRQMGDPQPQNQYSGMNPMQGFRQMQQQFGQQGGMAGGPQQTAQMGGMDQPRPQLASPEMEANRFRPAGMQQPQPMQQFKSPAQPTSGINGLRNKLINRGMR